MKQSHHKADHTRRNGESILDSLGKTVQNTPTKSPNRSSARRVWSGDKAQERGADYIFAKNIGAKQT